MYLHLGQSIVIREDDVIGFFDLDNTTSSHITRKFLGEAEKSRRITNVSDGIPNSFIVCGNPKRAMAPALGGSGTASGVSSIGIYLTQMTTQTLVKRMEAMNFI